MAFWLKHFNGNSSRCYFEIMSSDIFYLKFWKNIGKEKKFHSYLTHSHSHKKIFHFYSFQ